MTTTPAKPVLRVSALKGLDTSQLGKYRKMLLVGDQGSGKTHLAGSATSDSRIDFVYYIGTEGVAGVETLYDMKKAYPDKMTIEIVDDVFKDMIAYYQKAKDLATQADKLGLNLLVVLDSASEYADRAWNAITKTDDLVLKGEYLERVNRLDWGTEKGYIEQMMRLFRDLPCHFLATCRQHEVYESRLVDKQERTVLVAVQIHIPGAKLRENFPSLFSQVLYMYTEPGVAGSGPARTLLCQETPLRKAKDRSGRLEAKYKNPTFSTLLDAFTKERREH